MIIPYASHAPVHAAPCPTTKQFVMPYKNLEEHTEMLLLLLFVLLFNSLFFSHYVSQTVPFLLLRPVSCVPSPVLVVLAVARSLDVPDRFIIDGMFLRKGMDAASRVAQEGKGRELQKGFRWSCRGRITEGSPWKPNKLICMKRISLRSPIPLEPVFLKKEVAFAVFISSSTRSLVWYGTC